MPDQSQSESEPEHRVYACIGDHRAPQYAGIDAKMNPIWTYKLMESVHFPNIETAKAWVKEKYPEWCAKTSVWYTSDKE